MIFKCCYIQRQMTSLYMGAEEATFGSFNKKHVEGKNAMSESTNLQTLS